MMLGRLRAAIDRALAWGTPSTVKQDIAAELAKVEAAVEAAREYEQAVHAMYQRSSLSYADAVARSRDILKLALAVLERDDDA